MASYDIDSQALQKAILDGTLPDHVALAELKWRLKLHVDSDNNSPLYDSIRRLLRDAMHMAMDAVAEGKPVVTVLKDMLLDLGRLKMQASAEHDLNVVTKGTKKVGCQYIVVTGLTLHRNAKMSYRAYLLVAFK